MTWINKVTWSEGLFLRPQLFQQQERYLESFAHKRAASLSPFYWGFSHYSIDIESLTLGKLVLASASGLCADGTPFDLPGQTLPPPPLTLLPEHLQQTIHLALPIRTPNGEETTFEATPGSLARFDVFETELRDANSIGQGARKRTDRIEIHPGQAEFHLVPDRSRPMDFEVFSVQEMSAQKADTTQELIFRPLFQTLNQDEGNHGRYFSLRREGRLASDSARRYGTRTPYVGTEVFVSLVDQQEAPYAPSLRYLSVQALLTNRDLPRLVPRNGHSDLSVKDSLPLSAVGLVRPPSQPRAPFAQGEMAWRLIRQLNFNYLPLMDMNTRQGAQALRDMLRLFVGADDAIAGRQVDGLIGSRIAPVTRRLPGNGPLVYGRGVQCDLTVDEDAFSGTSPYLFGLVLEHYLARHVSINVFTETRLESMQRGMVASWAARMGTRSMV